MASGSGVLGSKRQCDCWKNGRTMLLSLPCPSCETSFLLFHLDVCVCAHSLSCVCLSVTLWTIAPRLLCLWDSLGKNTGVDCHALLQGIFPTQGSPPPHPPLLHCSKILDYLSHLGSLMTYEEGYRKPARDRKDCCA